MIKTLINIRLKLFDRVTTAFFTVRKSLLERSCARALKSVLKRSGMFRILHINLPSVRIESPRCEGENLSSSVDIKDFVVISSGITVVG